ncbi:hypothetical protein [Blastococcus sp. VKM Ac-2987]|uniref:hypothetical protein n=1 Tax=Blastococcus sp. VKM Ac-2987 TaxID=3004141 RepID=UPI0022ABBD56|nr:hypothetical protein [Blastococcus sp. VKM Ac-2987]MCZ2858481.1 hypothetical protein [Blastococcus sp. VKM Ac-2987]
MDAEFPALLEQVSHDGFMGATAVLTAVTVLMLTLAVRRILPKNDRDDTLPSREQGRR